jgi:hypothetical protein
MPDTNTQQTGGPNGDSEYRKSGVRPGQLEWVPLIRNRGELKRWIFKFAFGAEIYLSPEVYPDQKKRKLAWMNALLRAATQGGFEEMEDLLALLHSNDKSCEELLEALKQHFLPAEEAERVRASREFLNFARGKTTLLESVRALGKKVLECGRLGYVPDDATVQLQYEALLLPTEKPLYRSYYGQVDASITEKRARTLAAIEALGIDLEGESPKQQTDGYQFAGGAVPKRRAAPKRKGFEPTGKANVHKQATEQSMCGMCGSGACMSLQGKGREACKAYGKQCKNCGKTGHFAIKCRSKPSEKAGIAVTGKSLSDHKARDAPSSSF